MLHMVRTITENISYREEIIGAATTSAATPASVTAAATVTAAAPATVATAAVVIE